MRDRRLVLSVIGFGEPQSQAVQRLVEDLGRRAVEAGFRVCTGGLGGVMSAACRGAHQASNYREGDTLGVLPTQDAHLANEWVDIVIPSGLGIARNVLVVQTADVVVAVGGGSGTLSEIALAWQLGRPIIALGGVDGWAHRLRGERLDQRRDDTIVDAADAEKAVALALEITAGIVPHD